MFTEFHFAWETRNFWIILWILLWMMVWWCLPIIPAPGNRERWWPKYNNNTFQLCSKAGPWAPSQNKTERLVVLRWPKVKLTEFCDRNLTAPPLCCSNTRGGLIIPPKAYVNELDGAWGTNLCQENTEAINTLVILGTKLWTWWADSVFRTGDRYEAQTRVWEIGYIF